MRRTDQAGKLKPSSRSHPDAQRLLGKVLMQTGKQRGVAHYETVGKELIAKATNQPPLEVEPVGSGPKARTKRAISPRPKPIE